VHSALYDRLCVWRSSVGANITSFSGRYAVVRRLGRRGMRQSLEISETWGGFWLEGPKERERFGDLDLDIRIILKWILKT